MPSPIVTLKRNKDDVKLLAGNSETFACQVAKHRDIDTDVNVSLIWLRELHGKLPEMVHTEHIKIEGNLKILFQKYTVKRLNSLYKSIICKSYLYSVDERYIWRSEESNQSVSLDVQGMRLHVLNTPLINFLFFAGVTLSINDVVVKSSTVTSVLIKDLQTAKCHSDSEEANRQLEWRFPNGTLVQEDGAMVATMHDSHVTLSRADDSSSVPLGQYCCLAQDARGDSHTLCVNITESRQHTSRGQCLYHDYIIYLRNEPLFDKIFFSVPAFKEL